MRSVAGALLWQITRPYRWWLLAVGTYLLATISFTQMLPAELRVRFGQGVVSAIGIWLALPTTAIVFLLVVMFSLSAKYLKEEGFTTHMRVLPVRTRTLVAWPMVASCFSVMAVWWVVACLVLRPTGSAAPLWWPAAALALFLAVFQVLAWTPFAQRWLQASVMVAVFMVSFVSVAAGLLFAAGRRLDVGEPMIAAVLIALIPLPYACALCGVARARRGDSYDWKLWNRLIERAAARRPAGRRPFSSAARAQVWFECRAHGWRMPVSVGFVLSFFAFLFLTEPALAIIGIWKVVGMLLGSTLLVTAALGISLGNVRDVFSKPQNAAFVLTRPNSSVSVIQSKMLAAAINTAASWLLVPIFLSLLLLRPELCEPIANAAHGVPGWRVVGLPLLTLALLATVTWKTIVESLWIGLTGRDWVARANLCGIVVALFGATSLGYWIHFHPELQPTAWAVLPCIVGLFILCKLLAAACVIRSLGRLRLIGKSTVATMIVAWSLIVCGLYLAAYWLIPSQLWSASGTLAAVALFVPFSRPVGAPLALEWNRHR
ncbi:MAG: hypothetical protein ABSG53_12080 [Thermoguttaceae bacterium]|jgi:hypothetical protein